MLTQMGSWKDRRRSEGWDEKPQSTSRSVRKEVGSEIGRTTGGKRGAVERRGEAGTERMRLRMEMR